MTTLAKRNCLIYFRSPGNVALSLLGSLMVLVVYLLFLGDNLAQSIPGFADGALLVHTWMLAGLCAVAPLTTSLGVVGALVADRERGAAKDFTASPVARYKIAGGYLASGVVASFLLCGVVLAVCIGWVALNGGALPGVLLLAKCLGVLALACVSSACISFFIVTFIHKNGSYSTASTLVGTLGGFLAGIYLPIGSLPAAVQTVVVAFPPSHAAVLLRSLLLEGMAAESYAGAPAETTAAVFKELGVRLYAGGEMLPLWVSVAVLAASAALFFLLGCLSVARKGK